MAEGEDDFADMFRREYQSVVRAVLPIVGDQGEAEAIAQDAFEKALGRWGRIRNYDRPGGWVRRVAIRDAVRSFNRGNRASSLRVDSIAASEPVTDRIDLRSRDAQAVPEPAGGGRTSPFARLAHIGDR